MDMTRVLRNLMSTSALSKKNILHRNKTPNFSVLLLIMVILSLFASTSVSCFFRSLWFSASSCMSVSFRCSSSILIEKKKL